MRISMPYAQLRGNAFHSTIEAVFNDGFNDLLLLILIEEALDAAFCVEQLMLASEERVTSRTNFNLDVVFGCAGFDNIAASARDSGFVVNGMNALFHK